MNHSAGLKHIRDSAITSSLICEFTATSITSLQLCSLRWHPSVKLGATALPFLFLWVTWGDGFVDSTHLAHLDAPHTGWWMVCLLMAHINYAPQIGTWMLSTKHLCEKQSPLKCSRMCDLWTPSLFLLNIYSWPSVRCLPGPSGYKCDRSHHEDCG